MREAKALKFQALRRRSLALVYTMSRWKSGQRFKKSKKWHQSQDWCFYGCIG